MDRNREEDRDTRTGKRMDRAYKRILGTGLGRHRAILETAARQKYTGLHACYAMAHYFDHRYQADRQARDGVGHRRSHCLGNVRSFYTPVDFRPGTSAVDYSVRLRTGNDYVNDLLEKEDHAVERAERELADERENCAQTMNEKNDG